MRRRTRKATSRLRPRLLRRPPRKPPRNRSNARVFVAGGQRQSPAAVAQPILALAHRDVLGLARQRDYAAPIPKLPVGTPAGVVSVSALGLADAPPVA